MTIRERLMEKLQKAKPVSLECPDCGQAAPEELHEAAEQSPEGVVLVCGACARGLEFNGRELTVITRERWKHLSEFQVRMLHQLRVLAEAAVKDRWVHWMRVVPTEERNNALAGACFGIGQEHETYAAECAVIAKTPSDELIADMIRNAEIDYAKRRQAEKFVQQVRSMFDAPFDAPSPAPSRPQRERFDGAGGARRRRRLH